MSKPASKVEPASFEQAIAELEKIVRKLESGSGDLESSIDDYLRGAELRDYCEKKLKDARMKVEKIVRSDDGAVSLEPLDAE